MADIITYARTIAPYFSLARALWIPAVYLEDAETDALRRVEGPEGFEEYERAVGASRFLVNQSRPGSHGNQPGYK